MEDGTKGRTKKGRRRKVRKMSKVSRRKNRRWVVMNERKTKIEGRNARKKRKEKGRKETEGKR